MEYSNLESVIQECGRRRALNEGRQVHHLIRQRGLHGDRLLANLLIQMYGKCGDVSTSLSVFHSLPAPNVFTWTIMLEAFAANGYLHDAVTLFKTMPERNVASWTTMIKAYATFRSIDQAKDIFNRMPERNVTSWNAMLSAYATEGHGLEALAVFMAMNSEGVKGNSVTFIILLNAAAKTVSLAQAKLLHSVVMSTGMDVEVRVCNGLINLYGHCSAPDVSRRIFDEMAVRSTVTWNSMIAVHAKYSQVDKAKELFERMHEPDIVSWNTIISAYAECPSSSSNALTMFRRMSLSGMKPDKITFLHVFSSFTSVKHFFSCRTLHGVVLESGFRENMAVGTALVCSYSRCGSLRDARRVIEDMSEPDVIAWTAMITALAHHGLAREALDVLKLMDLRGTTPTEVTLLGALDACAGLGDFSQGKVLEAALAEAGMDRSGILGNSLIDMYGWCGSTRDAWESFQVVLNRTRRETVAWNAMIGAFSRNSEHREAVHLFRLMNLEGVKPEGITVVNVLDSCSVSDGKSIHSSLAGSGLETDLKVQNALITMYAEGGSLERAKGVFDGIAKPNTVSWSAVITAYLGLGSNSKGWSLFQRMNQEGEAPDGVTFIAILSACAHAGLWEDGCKLFLWMQQDHFIAPSEDHFMCMADLLGRTGKLQEAEDVLNGMPVEPSVVAWTSLLACCKTGSDSERADRVSEIILRMKSRNSGPYVLLSDTKKRQNT